MKKLGERLKELREGAGISQTKLAEFARTNQSSVNRYENGKTTPPPEILLWYADYFDVSLDYVYGRANDPRGGSDVWGGRFKGQVAAVVNARDTEPVLVRDLIMDSIQAHPDLCAYMYKEKRTGPYMQVSYREFALDVHSLGSQLVEMGLSGKRIAVIGDNCYQWAVTYFAVLFGVGVIVPFDKELRADEIKNLLRVAECDAIFYTERYDEIMDGIKDIQYKVRMNVYTDAGHPEHVLTWSSVVEAGKNLPQGKIDEFIETPIDENAMAALLFTSGTTGNAKGVMLSNRGMGTNIRDMSAAHNVKPGGSTVSILPMHHIFEAVMGQQFMLSNGVAIAVGDGLKYIQKNMEEVRPTVMLFVPLLIENFYGKIIKNVIESGGMTDLQRRINDYVKLRAELGPGNDVKARMIAREIFKEEQALFGGRLDSIFTGAAAASPRVIQGLQEIGIKLTNGYGMTECGPLMTTTPYFSDTMGKVGSVGPMTPSGTMRINNPDEKGIGEIFYKGPTVMLGYYGRPEETAEVMRGGWFHTGDYGVIDDDGWLYITGRENNIIVTKTGKNVFPEELEAVLSRNPFIEEIMVYASEDKKRGGALISAQIRPDYSRIAEEFGAEAAADDGRVVEILREVIVAYNSEVANYKRIRHIAIRIDEFVKTPTKKIMRSRNV